MRESEYAAIVARREASGRETGDPDRESTWRDTAARANLNLLEFYGRYLIGQYAGMSRALSLDSVKTALEIEEIDRDDWPEMTSRLITLHAFVVEAMPK